MNSELKGDIRTVQVNDPDYPGALRELADRPPVLYVKGRWPLPEDRLMLGIVGARRASAYGVNAAEHITSDMVRKVDVVTISGLAAGVDAAAHRATLSEKGWTVAVLGHGFGHLFPKENAPLFNAIGKEGTLVTEFPYDTPPLSQNFPQRNRIISGLSRGVVVVEAGDRSGALITARCAAEQGRDVFAVPGTIFSPLSRGCHRLIKEGAKLVETAGDILEEYGYSSGHPATPPQSFENLSGPEQQIVRHLLAVPLSMDELVELTGRSVDRLAEVLLSLELKGRIQSMPGQRYVARY